MRDWKNPDRSPNAVTFHAAIEYAPKRKEPRLRVRNNKGATRKNPKSNGDASAASISDTHQINTIMPWRTWPSFRRTNA